MQDPYRLGEKGRPDVDVTQPKTRWQVTTDGRLTFDGQLVEVTDEVAYKAAEVLNVAAEGLPWTPPTN